MVLHYCACYILFLFHELISPPYGKHVCAYACAARAFLVRAEKRFPHCAALLTFAYISPLYLSILFFRALW